MVLVLLADSSGVAMCLRNRINVAEELVSEKEMVVAVGEHRELGDAISVVPVSAPHICRAMPTLRHSPPYPNATWSSKTLDRTRLTSSNIHLL